MKRRGRDTLVGTATCSAWGGYDRATGRALQDGDLHRRVAALVGIASSMATDMVAEHWGEADLASLASGVAPDGMALPSNGYMAMRRLGWVAAAPAGVVVSDRVRRMAEEAAARSPRTSMSRASSPVGYVTSRPRRVWAGWRCSPPVTPSR